jgi:predicted amidohydrolase YtcJ
MLRKLSKSMRPLWFPVVTFLCCLATALLAFGQAPDTIYFNGKIVTVTPDHPVVKAVAIRGGRFVAVGEDAEILRLADSHTERINLEGRCVVPGLIDGHVHPIMAGLSEEDGPVPVFHSIPEIQDYIRQQAAKLPPDRLIFVPKVYASRLKERRYPTRQEIDVASGSHEAVVDNGYASVLNSAVLRHLEINKDTAQPGAGRIEKDLNGEPTGLILGAPQLLARVRTVRPITPRDRLWALREMLDHYNRVGITAIIDRGESPEGFRAYQTLHDAEQLKVRSYVTYLIKATGSADEVRNEVERFPFLTGFGDEWLRVGSLKTIVDGGILIGTAYMREPYGRNTQIYGYSDPDFRGVLTVPRENVFLMAQLADELGWQMTAHVTGGGALDLLLDAYEAADRVKPIAGRRFTATHANFPNARAIERARKLGVAFDVQPAWLHFDGTAIRDVLGPERMKDFLPLRSLLDAGLIVVGGSDQMVRFDARLATNPYHPFYGMWMAITRETKEGLVIDPEQRISREQALKMWTWNNASLMFAEKEIGSIEAGKRADMVVITKDFLDCLEDEIKDIEALRTIVGGKVVYNELQRK